ncbi:unnamed protein product [Psylliodes chrysocephalus]|uniref:Uncharacterized protein n=1 Tax=Psylliodes chrysocephalus TaxID=3402493 RepID=A0A9P0CN18_9CUCU|nr:unnamed protein product [Psylliodes chrysocephala]
MRFLRCKGSLKSAVVISFRDSVRPLDCGKKSGRLASVVYDGCIKVAAPIRARNEMSDSSVGEPSEFEDSESEYNTSDKERWLSSPDNLPEHETTIDNPTNTVPGPSHFQDFLSLKEKRKLSRKRLRHNSEWKRETAKRARAAGQEYLNIRGQVVPANKFYDDDCTCHKKCHSLFTLEERKLIFDNFYKLKNFDLQKAFIFGRRALTDLPRRQNTRIYLLPKTGVDVIVCKTFFKKV